MSTRTTIQNLLEKQKLDALIVSSVPNITYLTNYAGFSQYERGAYLLITKNHNYIFTDGRYTEAVLRDIPGFILKEITGQSPFSALLKELIAKHSLVNIGFEEDDLSVKEYKTLKKIHKKLHPISLHDLRIVKTDGEINAIKKACEIGDKAFEYILTKIKKRITEKQLAFKLEVFIKKKGADLSFPSIVAFGSNSSVPHHQTGNSKLVKNSFVLLDFGVKHDNYCSDMTRTVFFGKPNDKQNKIHQTVLEAQQKATNFLLTRILLVQGVSLQKELKASGIDKAARDYIVSQGFPSIPHSLGHGIGIEVHEAPSLSQKSKYVLENGMVFSIEPGIYLPGFGGVRIEDLFAIQRDKLVQLTKSLYELTVLQ